MRLEHDHDDTPKCDYIRCMAKKHGESIRTTVKELFTPYAFPGGYSIVFVTDKNDVLCSECAKRYFLTEKKAVTMNAYDEGDTLYCEDCNTPIESSYGPIESEV